MAIIIALCLVGIVVYLGACKPTGITGPSVQIRLPSADTLIDVIGAPPLRIEISSQNALTECKIYILRDVGMIVDSTIKLNGRSATIEIPAYRLRPGEGTSRYEIDVIASDEETFSRKEKSFWAFKGSEKLKYYVAWGGNTITVLDADFNELYSREPGPTIDDCHAIDQYAGYMVKLGRSHRVYDLYSGEVVRSHDLFYGNNLPVNKTVTSRRRVHVSFRSEEQDIFDYDTRIYFFQMGNEDLWHRTPSTIFDEAVVQLKEDWIVSTGDIPYVIIASRIDWDTIAHHENMRFLALSKPYDLYGISYSNSSSAIHQVNMFSKRTFPFLELQKPIDDIVDFEATADYLLLLEKEELILIHKANKSSSSIPFASGEQLYCNFWEGIPYLIRDNEVYKIDTKQRSISLVRSFSHQLSGFETGYVH